MSDHDLLSALLVELQRRGASGWVFLPSDALRDLCTAVAPPGPLQQTEGWRLALRVRAAYEGAGYPVHTDGQRSYEVAGLVLTVEGLLDA
jgi:hypothetical protein